MTKKISNSDFERALNDKNNVLIMEKAILPFRSSLTHDEMIECKLISLWEAMKSWKREKRGKFTTFLYQKVRWQCIKIVQGNNKCRYLTGNNEDERIPDTVYFHLRNKWHNPYITDSPTDLYLVKANVQKTTLFDKYLHLLI